MGQRNDTQKPELALVLSEDRTNVPINNAAGMQHIDRTWKRVEPHYKTLTGACWLVFWRRG